jgi:hypothetical protein
MLPGSKPTTSPIDEEAARKAALLSFAATGLMELHQDDEAWPLRDAADALDVELRAIAKEVRDDG